MTFPSSVTATIAAGLLISFAPNPQQVGRARYWSQWFVGFRLRTRDVDDGALGHAFRHPSSGLGPAHCLGSNNGPLFRFHQLRVNLSILELGQMVIGHCSRTNPYRDLRLQLEISS